jgi:hypothetical protein
MCSMINVLACCSWLWIEVPQLLMPMSYLNLRCLGWTCVVGDTFARSIVELMKSRIQISKIRVLVMS